MRSIFVFFILVMMVLNTSNTLQSSENDFPVISEDGKYHLQIVMYQWQFDVYNLQANESIEDAIENGNYIGSSGPDGLVGPLLVNTEIVFEVYSKDVQHGFSIDALGIALATNRPVPGAELGSKRSAATVLPSEPIVMEAYCHIFCGRGHPDEKMSFQVTDDTDVNSIESDNLQLPFLAIPFVFTLISIIFVKNKNRIKP